MKLKDDDILQVGDIVHFRGKRTSMKMQQIVEGSLWLGKNTVGGLKDFFSYHSDVSDVKKVTRKSTRVSRKEYKRRALEAEKRIETALQYVTYTQVSLTGAIQYRDAIAKILRGEE